MDNQTTNNQINVAIISSIRIRAKLARKLAWFMTLITIIIVFLIISLFFISPQSPNSASSSFIKIFGITIASTYAEPDSITNTKINTESKESIESTKKIKQLEREARERIFFSSRIGNLILRLGAFLVAVYLIQILVSYTRYHFRVSDHLQTVADSLEISDGNITKFETVSNIMSLKHIEFGKIPQSSHDKVESLIKESMSKLTLK